MIPNRRRSAVGDRSRRSCPHMGFLADFLMRNKGFIRDW